VLPARSVGACNASLAMGRFGRWEIPAEVVRGWVDSHGDEAVRAWLADARKRAACCADAWQVSIDGFLPGGSLSCVLAGRRADGSRVVLKLLAPWAVGAIASEALALSSWKGCGVVELLERTSDGRVLLLRRVSPGRSFSPSGDDASDCERVGQTLRVLASAPVVVGLPALSAAVRGRFGRARVASRGRRVCVGAGALNGAEYRAVELAETAPAQGAVHGDAQNKNLLVDGAGGALVAIDPEPCVGDLHFDAALWALTHRPGEGVRERCAVLAVLLGLDEARLWSWCLALAVAEVALDLPERARAQRELLARSAAAGG
jgi:streptomycin 6-kinase